MNNLEQMKKKRNRISTIIAILIVLNLLLLLAFATTIEDDSSEVQTMASVEEEPKPIEGDPNIADVGTGANFTIALDSNGYVWGWGQNSKGQLSSGTLDTASVKQAVLLEEIDTKTGEHKQLSNVKQIAVGKHHSLALTNDGKVYVWGDNYFGQANSEVLRKEIYPRQIIIPTGESVKQIVAGADCTLILTNSGKILGFGNSSNGQLGYYNNLAFTSIREIEELGISNIKEISAGNNHVLALTEDGYVYSWGDTSGSYFKATSINQISIASTVVQIQAGNGVSIALGEDGNVYTWTLGSATASKVTLPSDVQIRADNTKDNIGIVNKTYYIIDTNNNLYSWGQNTVGQVGNGSTTATVSTPTKLQFANDNINQEIVRVVSSVVSGISATGETSTSGQYDTAYAINADGYVLGWGYAGDDVATSDTINNNYKLLGNGTRYKADYIGSTTVKSLVGKDIKLEVGETANLLKILKDGGYIIGGKVNLYREEKVSEVPDLEISVLNTKVASYDKETGDVTGLRLGKTQAEIKSSNTVYARITVRDKNAVYPKIQNGDYFTIALKSDGTVWGWGYNSNLGITGSTNSNNEITSPTKVQGLDNITDIAVGPDYVLVLKNDSTVWGWGVNSSGQLGNGTTTNVKANSILTTVPTLTQVKDMNNQPLSGIISISTKYDHSMALDIEGNIWTWGSNTDSKLGRGKTVGDSKLAKKMDLTNLEKNNEIISEIVAGKWNSYVLTETGNIYACGYSGNKQCGNISENQNILVKVPGLEKITKISTSNYSNGYTLALTNDGRVYAFGSGFNAPSLVSELNGVSDIEAVNDRVRVMYISSKGTMEYRDMQNKNDIYTHTFKTVDGETDFSDVMLMESGGHCSYITHQYYTIVRADGTVWTSGYNSYGVLGNRTTITKGNGQDEQVAEALKLSCISYPYIELRKDGKILTENEVTLKVGQTADIEVNYNYGFNIYYDKKDITETTQFESQNINIATVSGNTITAVNAGKSYVTVTTQDGEKLRVTVNVLLDDEITMPKIASGYRHTIALKSDGTVWGWGYNSYGELNRVATITIAEPTKLNISGKFVDVATGYYSTALLREDGTVITMGYNGYGQLGNNSTTISANPVVVQKQDGTPLTKIVKIVGKYNSYLALDEEGNLYAWGYGANKYATLVDTYGKVRDISEYLILTEDNRVWEYENLKELKFVDNLDNVVQISSSSVSNSISYAYFMALDGEGNVYTWTRNTSISYKVSGTEIKTPTIQTMPENVKIVNIQAGSEVAYVIDEHNKVYSWGKYAEKGTLGQGQSIISLTTPTLIEGLTNIEDIEATTDNAYYSGRAYAITTSGLVYSFGKNDATYKLLGNSENVDYYYTPKLIGETSAGFMIDGKYVSRIYMHQGTEQDVTVGFLASFCLRAIDSETGLDTQYNWSVFDEEIANLKDVATTARTNTICAGNIIGETVVIADEINESNRAAKLYIQVIGDRENDVVVPKIESADNHTVALKSDGTVWGWGYNNYGELGIYKTGLIKEPQQIRIAERIEVTTPTEKEKRDGKQIYVDSQGNEYLKSGNDYTDLQGNITYKYDSGKLYKWDSLEGDYKLIDIKDSDGNTIKIVDIATSNKHTLLLTKDGDIYSCGYEYNGQLGYSTLSNAGYKQCLPKKIDELKDIVKISVAENFSLALDQYGRLWGFGRVTIGSISAPNAATGSGSRNYSSINSRTPVRLREITGVDMDKHISDAVDITNEYLLNKNGEVISLNVSTNSSSVSESMTAGTKVQGINGKVIKITKTAIPGKTHTAFLTKEGTVYTIGTGIGSTSKGELGNNTVKNSYTVTGNKYTAVQVLNENNEALTNIKDVYCGTTHTIAIDKSGQLYTWGSNTYGELRSASVQKGVNLTRAYKTKADDRIGNAILVSAGNGFTMAVDETGYVYACGLGTSGQLGNGLAVNSINATRVGIDGIKLDKNSVTLKENSEPIEITALGEQLNLLYDTTVEVNTLNTLNESVAQINKVQNSQNKVKIIPVNAGTTSAIIKSSGEDIGVVNITVLPENAEIASDVILPENKTISPMTVSGYSHTLILKSNGTVWAYGQNNYGQTARAESYSDEITQISSLPTIIQVASGDEFSVALDVNGNVYTWGRNNYRQLGTGSTAAYVKTPTKISTLSNIVKIAAGANHCLALDSNGYVYAWGKNTAGSLGTGSTANVTVPVQINNVVNVIDIAAGDDHSMILTSNGSVYTTGNNNAGQLGEQYIVNRVNFERVNGLDPITQISAGSKISLAIDIYGKLWAWGNNSNGQLGLGDESELSIYVPTVTTLDSRLTVESATAGLNHIQVVTTDGDLYVAGANNYGQLGLGENVNKTNTFKKVAIGTNVMRADAGTTYSTVISKAGVVYAYGDYNHGDTYKISATKSFLPVMLSDYKQYLSEKEITIKLGETYTIDTSGSDSLNVLYKEDASLYTYESKNNSIASVNTEGIITGNEIGTTVININSATNKHGLIVKVVPSDAIQSPDIDGGKGFTIVTDKAGTAYVFGDKTYIVNKDIPKIINNSISLKTVKAGDNFIVALNQDGTVWVMGDNPKGQLGIAGSRNTSQIVRLNVNNIKDIAQIDAGSEHAIALSKLGVLYVWGDNSNGQLGIDIGTSTVTTPTAVSLVDNRVTAISAGGNYSSIIDAEGKVYIIKNGKANEVSGISNAIKVATGTEETLVLTSNGSMYIVNNATNQVTPKILVGKEIVDIETNADSFMCLTSDKELYTYGNNTNGQLGNSNSSTELTKVAENVFTIGAGNDNTYYINTEGEVYSAGTNALGQLGNGTRYSEDTITRDRSAVYTKLGDRTYNIKLVKDSGREVTVSSTRVSTNWKILVGEEALKEHTSEDKTRVMLVYEDNEFNTFGNSIFRLSDYSFNLADTSIADLSNIVNGAEIVTKDLGETILQVTNNTTGEIRELNIIVVDEKLLRIEDMYITDSNNNNFEAEAESKDKFNINTEGSKDSGKLNIFLEFPNDTLEVKDAEGNTLRATQNKNEDKNQWIIEGLDLAKTKQELTLIVTTTDGEKFEYTIEIRKDIIVKVESEILTPKPNGDYIKFVNPINNTATIEITIIDDTKRVKLLDDKNNEITFTTSQNSEGKSVLTVNAPIPEDENEFVVKILKGEKAIDRISNLTIIKSSLESVIVKDDSANIPMAKNESEEAGIVNNFYVEIADSNETAKVTMNIRNENVQIVKIDGTPIDSTKLSEVTFTTDKNEVNVELEVLDPGTNTTYTENYILIIYKVSSNNNIDGVTLTQINGNSVNGTFTKLDEEDTYEIVLHDKTIDINNISFILTLENEFAKVSTDRRNWLESSTTITNLTNKISENQYQCVVYVQAENGTIKEYKLNVYKESESAKVIDITTINELDDGTLEEHKAEKQEDTNDYIVKVVKNKENYEIVITLENKYATIDEITVDGIAVGAVIDGQAVNVGLTLKSAENGIYTYTATNEVIGKTIGIKTKPEYSNIAGENYTLVVETIADGTEFRSIMVGDVDVKLETEEGIELTELEAEIRGGDRGLLSVITESETATIVIYDKDPSDTSAQKKAEGKGMIETELGINIGETTTVYIQVTSEDGRNTIVKPLTVTRLSNDTRIQKVIIRDASGKIIKEEIYTLDETEDTTEKVIVVPSSVVNSIDATIEVELVHPKAVAIINGEIDETTDTPKEKVVLDFAGKEKTDVSVFVTAEDGTEEIYTITVGVLTSDTETQKSIQSIKSNSNADEEQVIIKDDTQFIKVSENRYTIGLKSNVGDKNGNVNFVVTPVNPEVKQTIKLAITNKNGTKIAEPEYVDNQIIVNCKDTTEVTVKVTAEDGISKDEYVVEIVPKGRLLDSASVIVKNESNQIVQGGKDELTESELDELSTQLSVHPTTTKATIALNVNSLYKVTSAECVVNQGLTDDYGKDLSTNGRLQITGQTITVDIDLLDRESNVALINMTINGEEPETFALTITKGSTTAKLEAVTVEGTKTKYEKTASYINLTTNSILVDSEDTLYNIIAQAADNGTCRIYAVSDNTTDLRDITLNDTEDITDNPQVELDYTNKRFIIVVTSEFENNTERYELYLKKLSNNANLSDLDVNLDAETKHIADFGGFDSNNNINILIPSSVENVSIGNLSLEDNLSSIKWTNVTDKTLEDLTDEDYNDYTGNELQINLEDSSVRYVYIKVIAENGTEKVYTLNIKKQSNNTNAEIQVNIEDKEKVVEVTTQDELYIAGINVNEDPTVTVIPEDSNATIADIKVYKAVEGDLDGVITVYIQNNKIRISKLKDLYTDDSTEDSSDDNRYIYVQFNVVAEDTNVVKPYKLKLTRQHIETGVNEISYNYNKEGASVNENITLNAENLEQTIEVNPLVESVNFAQIVPNCKNASVTIKVQGQEKEQTADGFNVELTEETEGYGCTKTVEIIVTAESGDTVTYTITINRLQNSIILSEIKVKPLVETEEAEKVLQDTLKHDKHFTQVVTEDGREYNINETVIIPTEWTKIAIGDITSTANEVIITRIDAKNPYEATEIEQYTQNSEYTMPEGEHIYFKVVLKEAARSDSIYVIDLYKKDTQAQLETVLVNKIEAKLDEVDGIYKARVKMSKSEDKLSLEVNTVNTIIKDRTEITSITIEGKTVVKENPDDPSQQIEELENLVGTIIKEQTVSEKQVSATLQKIKENFDKEYNRVLTLTVQVQPEDESVAYKNYVIEIALEDSSAEIENITGNNEDIKVDNQVSHYKYAKKETIDSTIYTQYIDDIQEVETVINAQSKYANIEIKEMDSKGTVGEVIVVDKGQATCTVQTPELLTRLQVTVKSEDTTNTKVYEVWFIKKSNDASIKELNVMSYRHLGDHTYTSKHQVSVGDADENYYVEISDAIDYIDVELIPNYELANVSINAQEFEIKKTKRRIENIKSAVLEEGYLKIELKVQIPAEQAGTEENVVNTKYLFITRLSTDNALESISTNNLSDVITPIDKPQWGPWGIGGYRNRYVIRLASDEDTRNNMNLTIVAKSPKAKLELFDKDGNSLDVTGVGTLNVENLNINREKTERYKVRVTPEFGNAKEYYIDLVPAADEAELKQLTIKGQNIKLESGVYKYNIEDLNLSGIGNIYAIATANKYDTLDSGTAIVTIYTKDGDQGITSDPDTGYVTYEDVNLDDISYITITIVSPSGKNSNTYVIGLRDEVEIDGIQVTTEDITQEAILTDQRGIYTAEIDVDHNPNIKVLTDNTNIKVGEVKVYRNNVGDLSNVTVGDIVNNEFNISGLMNTNDRTEDALEDNSVVVEIKVIDEISSTSQTYKLKLTRKHIETGLKEISYNYNENGTSVNKAITLDKENLEKEIIVDSSVESVSFAKIESICKKARIEIMLGEDPVTVAEEGFIVDLARENQREEFTRVIKIIVTAENGDTKEYTIRVTRKAYISNDSSLMEVSYIDVNGEKQVVEQLTSKDKTYTGEYEISLQPEQNSVDISMTATNESAMVKADSKEAKQTLVISRSSEGMSEDIVLDIVVIAEDKVTQSKYKLTIKKVSIITGAITTENHEKNYSGVEVNIINPETEEVITTGTTEADGIYRIEVIPGNYNMIVGKAGYLTYTMTDIPVNYGMKVNTETANLIAGEVAGDDEYINLKDLVTVNKVARTGVIDDTNRKCDFNEDGVINEVDANIVVKNYYTSAKEITYASLSEDKSNPVISDVKCSIESDGIHLKANTTDDKELANIKFYMVNETETLIYEENLTGQTANVETVNTTINTEFNKVYKIKVVVTDKSGKETEVYQEVTNNIINAESDLVKFSALVEAGNTYEGQTIILANDITLNAEIKPIGNNIYKFKGTFDGNGHTIELNINTTSNYTGLFGYTENATIKNVGVSGSIVSIRNSVGGIVGTATNTTIENCYNASNIDGKTFVGGIAGQISGTSKIVNCYNSGNISGANRVAGIVGSLDTINATIENCYNIGTITGTDYVGEIVGFKQAKSEENNIITSTITNCYYSGTNSGVGKYSIETDVNAITDETTLITDATVLLTSLSDAFKADFAEHINNGYPILKWQKEPVATYSMRPTPVSEITEAKQEIEEDTNKLILPVNTAYTITSEFGIRTNPATGAKGTMHYGIDIAADHKTPIMAIADGTVTYAGKNSGYGYCIEIEHIINGEKIYSFYAHLYEIDVKVGDTVTQGTQIALEGGIPGEAGAGISTGPHVHLEIRKTSGSYSSAVDPRNYLEF